MGYTTEFRGSLDLSRDLTEDEASYFKLFCSTRRMKRDVNKLMELYEGKHGYPFATENTPEAIYGVEGEYFAREDGQSGQKSDASIINYNIPPGQIGYDPDNEGNHSPGLWCQWEIDNFNGSDTLGWNGGEKFYNYVEWLKYLINRFFSKWGVILNGEIQWRGEEWDDTGTITVTDNVVTIA